jgi:hypothetical protein
MRRHRNRSIQGYGRMKSAPGGVLWLHPRFRLPADSYRIGLVSGPIEGGIVPIVHVGPGGKHELAGTGIAISPNVIITCEPRAYTGELNGTLEQCETIQAALEAATPASPLRCKFRSRPAPRNRSNQGKRQ